jgi:glutathione S-transferase
VKTWHAAALALVGWYLMVPPTVGQAQVPVLLVNGTVIPDSTAILNWLEQHHPQPALMPSSEKDRLHRDAGR